MAFALRLATPDDAPAIAKLRTAVAEHLTFRYGRGHWSSGASERFVLFQLRTSTLFIARDERGVIATLLLATKKPWAIDRSRFTDCERPLYLTDMAVAPELQRQGVGRFCIEEVKRIGREWPADAIRLDAYDAEVGAGDFYRKCGFREVGRAIYRNVPLIYFEMLL
jgi:GNAT superfamily N-acetyltransferase